jgi:shikimate kinase
MGSGKSTIGKVLADKLSYDFIEMDALLLEKSNFESITKIFSEKGEPFFRDLETSVAQSLTDRTDVVISTGGGAPCRSENIVALKSRDTLIVYLATSFETLHARIGNDSTRPLWQDLEKTRALFSQRDPIYRNAADLIVNSDTDIDSIVSSIQHSLLEGELR